MTTTFAKTTKLVKKLGINAQLFHRDRMTRKLAIASFRLPKATVPPTALPVDSTGGATVNCPMDDNDQYGICGPAMCDHTDRILAWRQGKGVQLNTDVSALLKQYLAVSGGDNGTDEDMLVGSGGIWMTGLAADPTKIVQDHLDIDLTDVSTVQYAIDQFYAVQMAWSVPDAFLDGFETGSVWPNAMTPDPNKGHYVPLADVLAGPISATDPTDVTGFYRLYTWGGWAAVSPAFVASVQPQGFIAFSSQQFDPSTGLDSKGRHVTVQATKWVACGGSQAIASAVVAMFPPAGVSPPPVVPPVVPPVTEPITVAGNVTLQGSVTVPVGLRQVMTSFPVTVSGPVSLTQTLTSEIPDKACASSKAWVCEFFPGGVPSMKNRAPSAPSQDNVAATLVSYGVRPVRAARIAATVFAYQGSTDYSGVLRAIATHLDLAAAEDPGTINPANLQLILAFLLEILPIILPLITGATPTPLASAKSCGSLARILPILALALCFLWPTPARADELPATPKASWFAARVSVDHGNGRHAQGSGTPIGVDGGKTLILTNAHVVEDATRPITVSLDGWAYTATYVTGSSVSHVGPSQIAVDGPDLCVLSIPYVLDHVAIADESPGEGAKVWQCGFGGSQWESEPITRTGHVVATRLANPTLSSTIAVVQGDSGAGVFNETGELVGVTWGGDVGGGGKSYAVEVKTVKRFLLRDRLRAMFPRLAARLDAKRTKGKTPLPVAPAPKALEGKPDVKATPATCPATGCPGSATVTIQTRRKLFPLFPIFPILR